MKILIHHTTTQSTVECQHLRWHSTFKALKLIMISLFIMGSTASAFDAKPFFEKYCNTCHDEDVSKADFRTDQLIAKMDFNGSFIKWEHTLMHLVDRSMPPKKKKKRPQHEEYEAAITWLRQQLIKAEMVRAEKKPKWMRRLNKKEYNNTIRDLFGVEMDISEAFPMDDAIHGFDNVAEGLMVSPIHIENYMKAAYRILDTVILPEKLPQSGKARYAINWDILKNSPNKPTGGLRLRDGNSFQGDRGKPKDWVGGPFMCRIKPKESGYYKFTLVGIPRNFKGRPLGAIHMISNKNRKSFDVFPKDNVKQEIYSFEGWINANGKHKSAEINWLNGHRKNTDSNFRKLQGYHKKKKTDKTLGKYWEELDWPIVEEVEVRVEGPYYKDLPNGFSKLFHSAVKAKNSSDLFQKFLLKLFRRAVTKSEIDYYNSIVSKEVKAGEKYEDALKQSLVTAMVSPDFLFLIETPAPGTAKGKYVLNDFELASRLSYFLWSSMPDEELFKLASQGKLHSPQVINQQISRMLKDPKAEALTTGFGQQWIGNQHIPNAMPEPAVFEEFRRTHAYGENLKEAMTEEPKEFFDVIRREDLDIGNFIDSDFVVINNEIAKLYDYKNFKGITFKKIPSQDGIRGGLITQAGILTVTSEATRTSPVKRGIWILETIFNRPPPPPPPNVEPLEEKEENGLTSMVQKLEAHRDNKACASCHMKIDPLGLALESFDGIGKLREKEKVVPPSQMYLPHWKQKPVYFEFPESTELEDGSKVKSVKEFKQHLMSRKDDFVRGFAEKMMIYALGRELLVSDQTAIDKIVSAVKKEKYKFSSVVKNVVLSNSFKTR